MTDNFVQLEKDNILRLQIKDAEGKPTGEHLEFDIEDIELPLIYQEMLDNDKKYRQRLKNEFVIIEKRQDVKGKKIFSKNQEDKLKTLKKFFEDETENLNKFLGKNGVQKLLNGRKLGWTSLATIIDIINNQIMPKLKINYQTIDKQIKQKYSIKENDSKVLK